MRTTSPTPRLLAALLVALLLGPVAGAAGVGPSTLAHAQPAPSGPGAPSDEVGGYVLAGADAASYAFGDAPLFPSSGGLALQRPVVDVAVTPDQAGYWHVAADGGVFAFGTATFHGSAGGTALNQPIVGMAPTPSGRGYWLVAADGGVFAYGDARFRGSMGARPLNQPIVGMAATPSGAGYWLVAADGGIFAFGDARFRGSMGAQPLNQPIVAMAATPSGAGYWLVAADGGVFAFGDARYRGSTGDIRLNQPVVDLAATPTGDGYLLVAADGGTFAFGGAPFLGSLGDRAIDAPVVAVEAVRRLPAELALTVLHNNDGESKVRQGDDPFGGAALFAGRLRALREAAGTGPGDLAAGSVTISSGDSFLAGPELNASFELPDDERYFDAVLVDLLDYDAVTIGNHEFDFGPEVLARFIADAGETPFLSANTDFSGEPSLQALVDAGRIAPSTVVAVEGRPVGIVGALTPGLALISSPGAVEVLDDVAGIVQAEVDALLDAGVTRIVVSSHLQGIDEEVALVGRLRGVDVIIAGGGDELMADDDTLLIDPDDERPTPFSAYPFVGRDASGGAVPIVTTPGDYSYVGRLQVSFDAAGNLLDVLGGGLERVSSIAPDAATPAADVQAAVVDPVEASVAELAANVLATSEVALDGRNVSGVPIRSRETNLGNLVADSMLFAAQQRAAGAGLEVPLVSLQNGGGIRNNSLIPAGPLTELDSFSILAFSNIVTIVEDLGAAELKELLEHSVSALPAADGRFGQWGGIRFTYDLSGTAQVVDEDTNRVTTPGTRIVSAELADGTDLVVGGQPVPGATASLATADFTGRGGDNYPFAGKGTVNNLGVSYQQALAEYLTSEAAAAPGGTLAGLDGTVTASAYPEVDSEAEATRIQPAG